MKPGLINIALGLACLAGLTSAATNVAAQNENMRTVAMALQPAAPPDPAMKFRLMTALPDREPGDAAQYYYRALGLLPTASFDAKWDKISQWLGTNTIVPPEFEAAGVLVSLKAALKEAATAGRRDTCHWEMPMKEGMGMMLPGLGNFKKLAQGLALQSRMQIAKRDWEGALNSLRSGFELGRNVGKGSTLIHGLVGISISQIMLNQVELWTQQPDAPNLYWALTALRRPLVDLRDAMEWENQCMFVQFPQLRELEKNALSVPEARRLLSRLMAVWTNGGEDENADSFRAEDAAYTLALYPQAKQALAAQGFAAEKLESFPAAQVAVIHLVRVFQHYSQDYLKWFYIPYNQAMEGISLQEKKWEQDKSGFHRKLAALPVLTMLPATSRSYTKSITLERNIDLLRCVEAVRAHAAQNGGKLPQTLKEIVGMPLPLDLITGREFDYKIEDGKAVLEVKAPPGEPSRRGVKYVIAIGSVSQK